MHLFANARTTMIGLTVKVNDDHNRTHPVVPDDAESRAAAGGLVEVLRGLAIAI